MINETDDRENEFGKNLVLARGWHFTPKQYQEAWQKKQLMAACIELSNLCDLNCEYCFRAETGMKNKRRLPGEITVEQTKGIIDQISDLGCKAVNIIGAGEPTVDSALPEILQYISGKKMIPILATHGARLLPLIQTLQETNSTVIVKGNSFNPSLQDKMVGRPGFSEKRDEGLRKLIEQGFNLPFKDAQTRLGINSIVYQANKHEVLNILKYCRNINAMPIMGTFIPAGRTKDRTDMEIPMQEFLELSKQAREIDKTEFGIEYNRLWPYFGGVPCTQCSKASLYVTILGDIFECPGQLRSYGNIKTTSVKEAFAKLREEQTNPSFSCPPRLAYWKKTGQIE